MKRIFFLLFALLVMSSIVVSAQMKPFPYTKTNQNTAIRTNKTADVFHMVEVNYSPVLQNTIMDKYTRAVKMNAFSLNVSQFRSILDTYQTHPLYLQYGLNLQYTYHINEDQDDVSYNGTKYSAGFKILTTFFTMKVPVNLLYSFQIPQTSLSFMPYAGAHMLVHLSGRQKDTEWESINGKKNSTTEVKSLFKDEDMGSNPCNRFGLGWQVGAKIAYDRLLFGLGYEGYLLNLQKGDDYKVRMPQVNISLGIMF